MNTELKAFVDKNKELLSSNWTDHEKAMELAMWAMDSFGNLPELDIGYGGVSQEEFDQAVEEAYTWLLGECKEYLK